MLKKSYSKTGKKVRVTFKLPANVKAKKAFIVGEFNEWDKKSHPMKKLKDGSFSGQISLDAEREYRFRYWLDNKQWENDWEADAYVPNEFGSENSFVKV